MSYIYNLRIHTWHSIFLTTDMLSVCTTVCSSSHSCFENAISLDQVLHVHSARLFSLRWKQTPWFCWSKWASLCFQEEEPFIPTTQSNTKSSVKKKISFSLDFQSCPMAAFLHALFLFQCHHLGGRDLHVRDSSHDADRLTTSHPFHSSIALS